jgi:hypothetical protein
VKRMCADCSHSLSRWINGREYNSKNNSLVRSRWIQCTYWHCRLERTQSKTEWHGRRGVCTSLASG